MLNDKYSYAITQTNYVIDSLNEDVKNKIPENVLNFFQHYSDMSLLNEELESKKMLFQSFTEDTLKFLKVIDYYINEN